MSGLPKKPLFNAETVIADWLGDIADGHPRVGVLRPHPSYDDLRMKAKALLADFSDNQIHISTTAAT